MLANLILTQEGHFIVEAIFCQFNELWILTFPICCYKFHEKGEGENSWFPKWGGSSYRQVSTKHWTLGGAASQPLCSWAILVQGWACALVDAVGTGFDGVTKMFRYLTPKMQGCNDLQGLPKPRYS